MADVQDQNESSAETALAACPPRAQQLSKRVSVEQKITTTNAIHRCPQLCQRRLSHSGVQALLLQHLHGREYMVAMLVVIRNE